MVRAEVRAEGHGCGLFFVGKIDFLEPFKVLTNIVFHPVEFLLFHWSQSLCKFNLGGEDFSVQIDHGQIGVERVKSLLDLFQFKLKEGFAFLDLFALDWRRGDLEFGPIFCGN